MKKAGLLVVCMVIVCGLGFSQVTQADLDKLNNAIRELDGVADSFIKVFPDVATQQNIEPRAWIGYLIQNPYPEITKKSGKVTRELPHFTVGFLNLGVAFANIDKINNVGMILNGEEIVPFSRMPLPSISIDARIGGIKTPSVDLPFDLGFSFFTLDIGSLLGSDAGVGLKWTNWGLDARYLIIRQNGAIPNVSANVGFARWALNLDTDVFDGELSTNTVYFGGQASYTLGGFFIPYLGLKMMTGRNKGTMTLTLDEFANQPIPIEDASRTIGPEKSFFQMQFFGGFGLDWLVFQTSIGGSINVFTGTPGLNFITRFSL
ncbi:MAG: hypothetical protein LBB78_08900 [Spirochaetaceae bacterium]|jgi:hypothetical protein|nr:hypothetical protein [Spirochaetaceae bacterium]